MQRQFGPAPRLMLAIAMAAAVQLVDAVVVVVIAARPNRLPTVDAEVVPQHAVVVHGQIGVAVEHWPVQSWKVMVVLQDQRQMPDWLLPPKFAVVVAASAVAIAVALGFV